MRNEKLEMRNGGTAHKLESAEYEETLIKSQSQKIARYSRQVIPRYA